jgi:HEAT repeat protein
MGKKYIATFLFILAFSTINSAIATAESINKAVLKNQAYETISKALFNEDIHMNMKVDIFDSLAEMTVQKEETTTGKGIINDFYRELISNPYKSTFTIDILADNQKEQTTNDDIDLKQNFKNDKQLADLLAKALQSTNESILIYSLNIIGKAGIDSLLPEVYAKLEQIPVENAELLATILTTIGEAGDETSLEKLKSYLDEKYELKIRLNALQSIGEIESQESKEILKNYLTSSQLELALLSAGILAQDGNEKALELLQEGIESPVVLTQQKTLIAMTNLTNPAVIPILDKAMDVENDVVKAYTLEILAAIDSPETIDVIKKGLDDEKLIPRALIALTQNLNSESVALFEEAIQSDNALKKTFTIAVLSQVKDKQIIPVLKIALEDVNESIQVAAAKILYTLGDKSGLDQLKKATESKNKELAIGAAAFLGVMGEDYGEPVLKKHLHAADMPSWKRLDIAIVLENLGNEYVMDDMEILMAKQRPSTLPKDMRPSEKALATLLNSEYEWTRLNASYFMSQKNNLKAIPVLEKLSENPDLSIRTTALSLLGKYNSEQSLPILKEHLDDEAVRARVNAAESLLKIINKEKSAQSQSEV